MVLAQLIMDPGERNRGAKVGRHAATTDVQGSICDQITRSVLTAGGRISGYS